jgi:hypothetical protein
MRLCVALVLCLAVAVEAKKHAHHKALHHGHAKDDNDVVSHKKHKTVPVQEEQDEDFAASADNDKDSADDGAAEDDGSATTPSGFLSSVTGALGEIAGDYLGTNKASTSVKSVTPKHQVLEEEGEDDAEQKTVEDDEPKSLEEDGGDDKAAEAPELDDASNDLEEQQSTNSWLPAVPSIFGSLTGHKVHSSTAPIRDSLEEEGEDDAPQSEGWLPSLASTRHSPKHWEEKAKGDRSGLLGQWFGGDESHVDEILELKGQNNLVAGDYGPPDMSAMDTFADDKKDDDLNDVEAE